MNNQHKIIYKPVKISSTGILVTLFLILTAAVAAQELTTESEPASSSRLSGRLLLHRSLTTVDTHIDIPDYLATAKADPALDGPMQVDIPKMITGGLDIGFFIVYVRQASLTSEEYSTAYQMAITKFDAIERMVKQNPYNIGLARSPEEAKALVRDGKIAAVIGVENGFPLGENLEHLDEFSRRGAQYISLVHDGNNHLADSARPKGEYPHSAEPVNNGLSETGKAAVRRMNELGIMVDVSHASKDTTLQIAALSHAPIIASHSSVKAVFEHARNLTDEELRAIAETGGVVQIVAFDAYLREIPDGQKQSAEKIRESLGLVGDSWFEKITQEQEKEYRLKVNELDSSWPRATVRKFVDHIDYAVKLIGIEHVGIASDFGGGGGIKGWDDASELPNVTFELVRRGYSKADLEKIMGGNLLRVWSKVRQTSGAD